MRFEQTLYEANEDETVEICAIISEPPAGTVIPNAFFLNIRTETGTAGMCMYVSSVCMYVHHFGFLANVCSIKIVKS